MTTIYCGDFEYSDTLLLPRPSLSGSVPVGAISPSPGVAGVDAPAFVEAGILRIDGDIDRREVALRLRTWGPVDDCARLLLNGGSFSGGFGPRFPDRPYITTSSEPPIEISTTVRASPEDIA